MPRPISQGERHTYNGWQRIGYQVLAGSVHVGRSETGAALFDASQVAPIAAPAPPRPVAPGEYRGPAPRRARPVERRVEVRETRVTPPLEYTYNGIDWSVPAAVPEPEPEPQADPYRDLRSRMRTFRESGGAPQVLREPPLPEGVTVDYRDDGNRVTRILVYPSGTVVEQFAPELRHAIRLPIPPDPGAREPQAKRKVRDYAPQDDEPNGFARFVEKAKRLERKEK